MENLVAINSVLGDLKDCVRVLEARGEHEDVWTALARAKAATKEREAKSICLVGQLNAYVEGLRAPSVSTAAASASSSAAAASHQKGLAQMSTAPYLPPALIARAHAELATSGLGMGQKRRGRPASSSVHSHPNLIYVRRFRERQKRMVRKQETLGHA